MADFLDRIDAGRRLAEHLQPLRERDVVVLGLPRGGVPVADMVAQLLDAPLDVLTVRKLGVPARPELAMGAISEQGVRVVDKRIVEFFGVTPEQLAAVERREQTVLQERAARFRDGRESVEVAGRTVVIVDDGIATGATARVACLRARHLGAARVVVAAPVASPQAATQITEADEVVALSTPRDFQAVGAHYQHFAQTTDEQVVAILGEAARRRRGPLDGTTDSAADTPRMEKTRENLTVPPEPTVDSGTAADVEDEADVQDAVVTDARIPAAHVELEGHFQLPAVNAPVVVFAHGSGSGRHSPRNQYVASVLQEGGLGTLLLDLLTPQEAEDRQNVFDIPKLAQRLTAAEAWVHRQAHSMSSPVGFFGASTGAGAALWAAAEPDARVGAVVSRGGRPDLADPRLGTVEAPTLLIVGGQDHQVLDLNRQAQQQLRCQNRLEVVEGATHLFEEPGTLDQAARLARDWFLRYLPEADVVDPETVP